MKKIILTVSALLCVLVGMTAFNNQTSEAPSKKKLPYMNAKLSTEERVKDLMSRMTLEEKVAQMCQYVGLKHIKEAEKNMNPGQLHNNDAHAFYPGMSTDDIEELTKKGMIGSFLHVLDAEEANYLQGLAQKARLKIPLIIGIDAIHGNALNYGATVYPSPITMASSWDDELVYKSSVETAKEMRAMGAHWAFTPNIDIARDPRWGRVGETFGEDTYLVGNLGVAMIKGFQEGSKERELQVIACAKHLIGGGQSLNGLNAAPTDISERTLQELHLPPYERAIREAKVFSIMTAHNELNGIPCHEDEYMMNEVCRKQYGFEGFFVSDWMDIERIATLHHAAKDTKEASMLSVNAGMDMHMHGPKFLEDVVSLVKEGKVKESRVDEACAKILEAKFNLGLFENPFVEEKKQDKKIFTAEHQATALEIARKSIVLLKNKGGMLPLKKDQYKNILVVGPNANNETILGDWHWKQPAERITTVYEGVKAVAEAKGAKVNYFNVGENLKKLESAKFDEAAKLAKNNDLIILAVGENSLRYHWKDKTCGENMARADIRLPGKQLELVKKLHATGKPVVVVLVNGRQLSEPWVTENIDAIVEAWEPGSFGGQAIAEVLYGDVNPSGKLPVTFPRSVGQLQMVYNHKPSNFFHKYAFEKNKPLYPFGYGLSYTKYAYSNVKLDKPTIKGNETATLTVDLANIGKVDGDEIVQLYIRDNVSSVTRPVKELKAYKRVSVKAGEKTTISFEIKMSDLAFYNRKMDYVVESGEFTIMVGGSSADKDLKKVTLTVAEDKAM